MTLDGKPLALFTGGPIGAGKSVLGDHVAALLGLVSLDADSLTAQVAAMRPRRPFWDSRPTALRLLDCWQNQVIASGTPVLVQTTASDGPYTLALQQRYSQAGFATAMAFVDAPDDLCRQRNAARRHPRPVFALEKSLKLSREHLPAYRAAFPRFASFTNAATPADLQQQAEAWISSLQTEDCT